MGTAAGPTGAENAAWGPQHGLLGAEEQPSDPGPSLEASPPLREVSLAAVVTGGWEARQIPS